jgi:hypothetical protein
MGFIQKLKVFLRVGMSSVFFVFSKSSILLNESLFQTYFCIVGLQVEPNRFLFFYFGNGANKIERTPYILASIYYLSTLSWKICGLKMVAFGR